MALLLYQFRLSHITLMYVHLIRINRIITINPKIDLSEQNLTFSYYNIDQNPPTYCLNWSIAVEYPCLYLIIADSSHINDIYQTFPIQSSSDGITSDFQLTARSKDAARDKVSKSSFLDLTSFQF